MISMYEIGDRVKDKITGFVGICDALSVFGNGITQYRVQAECVADGKPLDPVWFEEPQLELIDEQVIPSPDFDPPKFNFGDRVKDSVTGYEGVVHTIAYWLHGCIRYGVIGTVLSSHDGGVQMETFDDTYLELVAPTDEPPVAKKTGGPQRMASSIRR